MGGALDFISFRVKSSFVLGTVRGGGGGATVLTVFSYKMWVATESWNLKPFTFSVALQHPLVVDSSLIIVAVTRYVIGATVRIFQGSFTGLSLSEDAYN